MLTPTEEQRYPGERFAVSCKQLSLFARTLVARGWLRMNGHTVPILAAAPSSTKTQYTRVIAVVVTVTISSVLSTFPVSANDSVIDVSCSATALVSTLEAANDGDTVSLAAGCVYILARSYGSTANALPRLDKAVTIWGNSATLARAGDAPPFRILEVTATGSLIADHLTIIGGRAVGASVDGEGGALYTKGRVKFTSVVVRDNLAREEGGGIHVANGTLTVDASRIVGNTVHSDDFSVGGGIAVEAEAVVTLRSSHVSDNTAQASDPAGGGIASIGTVSLYSTTVTHNTVRGPAAVGGGIASTGILGSSRLNLHASNVIDNAAIGVGARGGGISNGLGSMAVLEGSTVAGNTADAAPGGIFNTEAAVSLHATRVAANTPTNCTGSAPPVPGCSN